MEDGVQAPGILAVSLILPRKSLPETTAFVGSSSTFPDPKNPDPKNADAIPGACVIFCAMLKRRPLTACLTVILLLSPLISRAGDETGEPAPRFRAKTTTGEQFNNDSIKGKVVLFEFWTTWCVYCDAEAGFVDQINHEFRDKGLIVLAVDVAESKKTVKKYLEQHPRTSRIVLTDDTNLAAMYEATVYPIYVVVDRQGNIAGTQRGAAGEEALRDLLASGGIESKEDSDTK